MLGPLLAETLAHFDLGTRKINFLASAQCRLIRIWHHHPLVHRRGRWGPRAALWFPWRCLWGNARDRGGGRQGPCPSTLLAGMWDADLQAAKPFRCKEGVPVFAGVCFILQSVSAAAMCPAWPRLLLPPPSAVPWVIPGCQPRSRAEGDAVPHVSFASLSPGQPAGLLLCSGGGD